MARVRVEPAAAAAIAPAAVVGLLAAAVLTGCGTGGPRAPRLASLPLVAGAHVVAQDRVCDKGANPYCALELVVTDDGYPTSTALVAAEHRLLRSKGWTGVNADTGDERAAESPGHRVRVTYATGYGDLKGIDEGWIHRSHRVALALSRAMFEQRSAMSALLEIGSG
jgi:hypothetical protein